MKILITLLTFIIFLTPVMAEENNQKHVSIDKYKIEYAGLPAIYVQGMLGGEFSPENSYPTITAAILRCYSEYDDNISIHFEYISREIRTTSPYVSYDDTSCLYVSYDDNESIRINAGKTIIPFGFNDYDYLYDLIYLYEQTKVPDPSAYYGITFYGVTGSTGSFCNSYAAGIYEGAKVCAREIISYKDTISLRLSLLNVIMSSDKPAIEVGMEYEHPSKEICLRIDWMNESEVQSRIRLMSRLNIIKHTNVFYDTEYVEYECRRSAIMVGNRYKHYLFGIGYDRVIGQMFCQVSFMM